MTTYVINDRVGEVHAIDCWRVKLMDSSNMSAWDPSRAHLLPGVTACPRCLTEVPKEAPMALLEDPDGAPYPEEVQGLMRLLQANTGTYVVDVMIRALEAMRLAGIQQARDALLEDAPPVNMELRPDGSTDPSAAIYVEGFHDALAAVSALLPKEEVPWDSGL